MILFFLLKPTFSVEAGVIILLIIPSIVDSSRHVISLLYLHYDLSPPWSSRVRFLATFESMGQQPGTLVNIIKVASNMIYGKHTKSEMETHHFS